MNTERNDLSGGKEERFRIFCVVVLPYMESARLLEGREGRASEKVEEVEKKTLKKKFPSRAEVLVSIETHRR
jgi:hypothetical protein